MNESERSEVTRGFFYYHFVFHTIDFNAMQILRGLLYILI
jgi:hypothetical protein